MNNMQLSIKKILKKIKNTCKKILNKIIAIESERRRKDGDVIDRWK